MANGAISVRLRLGVISSGVHANSRSCQLNFAGPQSTAVAAATVGTADLTIVGGGGHVGIPLVLAFAEAGFRVNVHDVNRDVLETLKSGRLPFIEYGGEELLGRGARAETAGLHVVARRDLVSPDRSSSPSARRSTSSSIRCARWCRIASTRCCRISPTASSWCCARRCFPARPIGCTAISSARAAISRSPSARSGWCRATASRS